MPHNNADSSDERIPSESTDAVEPGAAAARRDRTLERAIGELLDARALTSSICPSDVARHVGDEHWRDLMEPTRQAAIRLVQRGEVELTQHGAVIDPAHIRGPIRIRRPRAV